MISGSVSDRSDVMKAYLNSERGILFTSSTVFWEGITIRNLRLLIIPEPPFPRPRLLELIRRKVTDSRIDMSRRFLQGIGRIGRKKGEFGLVVVLFDPCIVRKDATMPKFRKLDAKKCLQVIHGLLEKLGHEARNP
jgi:Rad3-related DNA helicase